MAVPNTTTFNFQNVTSEVYGVSSAGMNLSQAFSDATGTFDTSFGYPNNTLLYFRNYQHAFMTASSTSITLRPTPDNSANVTIYSTHNWTSSVTYHSGSSWLIVTPNTGPNGNTVVAFLTGLSQTVTYTATVTFTNTQGASINVFVTYSGI